jgi:hypothetical protein
MMISTSKILLALMHISITNAFANCDKPRSLAATANNCPLHQADTALETANAQAKKIG